MFTSRLKQLLLVGILLVTLSVTLFKGDLLYAVQLLLSPLPPGVNPCVTLTNGGFVVNVFGYVTAPDGTTTITFAVKNNGKQDISHVSFSTLAWTRLEPANNLSYTGSLGNYTAVWTNSSGQPGFPSVKYTPLFSGYSKGKQDTLALRVAGFDPNAMLTVQIKAGQTVVAVTFNLAGPACNFTPTPTPTATATPTAAPVSPLPTPIAPPPLEAPDVNIYILNDQDFTTPLSETEKIDRWNQGLPVAVTETITSPLAFKPGLLKPVAIPLAQTGEGWVSMFSTDFVNGFPPSGQQGDCQLELRSSETISDKSVGDYQWGYNNYRFFKVDDKDTKIGAAWPFAGGTNGSSQNPGTQTYPENRRTQIICTFTGLNNSDLKNVMTEFALWLDAGNPYVDAAHKGDYFFVGFNTGGTNFYGYSWHSTPINPATNDPWQRYRFFYPQLADKVHQNGGTLKVMWSFTSDNTRINTARGAWLDNLMVERYIEPEASKSCHNLITDEKTMLHVTGAPGSGMVSKGLNLPPNSNDDSWTYGLDPALFKRLDDSNTKLVRLEFIAQPSVFRRLKDNTIAEGAIDLKHYDQLIDGLCAKNIAILGLLSYQVIPDKSWQRSDGEGVITPSYLNKFKEAASTLATYYDNRIGAWEIWNEPDYDPTGLGAADFARLLIGVKPVITDAKAKLVSGGIANVDASAREFLTAFYTGLIQEGNSTSSPFDVFGLHIYPSSQYVDLTGKLLLNPQQHWRKESPTVIAGMQRILQGGNALGRDDSDKDIWLTEFGWNGAKGSNQDLKNECPNQASQWVTKFDQAFYLGAGFDILFKETAWPNTTRPAITKAFWYQYQDTSSWRPNTDCRSSVVAANSPSWWVSEYRRGLYPSAPNDILVNWWFGLFDGNMGPNPAFCPYANYPEWATCYQFDQTVYLPVITQQAAPGQ